MKTQAIRKIEHRHKLDHVRRLKMESGCVDCGYDTDPRALDFDHVDPSTKSSGIARMIQDGVGWVRLLAEIEKCVVRCSNCHRTKNPLDGVVAARKAAT